MDVSNFVDTGRLPNTTYWYRVYAFNQTGNSINSNTDFATTDAGPAISLELFGHKVKGRHAVDLTWGDAGGSEVDIIRDGNFLISVPNSGSYTDETGNRGGRTYTYQLCEAGGAVCSLVQPITF